MGFGDFLRLVLYVSSFTSDIAVMLSIRRLAGWLASSMKATSSGLQKYCLYFIFTKHLGRHRVIVEVFVFSKNSHNINNAHGVNERGIIPSIKVSFSGIRRSQIFFAPGWYFSQKEYADIATCSR